MAKKKQPGVTLAKIKAILARDPSITNAAIARELGINVSTVGRHINNNGLREKRGGNTAMARRKKKTPGLETRIIPRIPGYSFARDGTIYSERGATPYAMLAASPNHGLVRVRLAVSGLGRFHYVAPLILEAWGEPRPAGHVVAYRDGDPGNCHLENLYWALPQNSTAGSAKEFVTLWQLCENFDEFIERSGLTETAAYLRARSYREKGVPLKSLARTKGLDWGALAALAEEIGEETQCRDNL